MGEQWHFMEHVQSARVRNPIQGEFFASEAIDGPAEALVREGIQNAGDARRRSDRGDPLGPVRVRLFLSGKSHAVPSESMRRYGVGLWQHVTAEQNGLKSPPNESETCQYLVFEDFGTTGLTGDTKQWKPKGNTRNSFFYFFRAEGLTDKLDGRGGSWGVGKYVFPRSSRANAILALTVRADDRRRLAMGTMTLKTHEVGGTWYTPDGLWGDREAATDMVMPSDNQELAQAMLRDFGLTRGIEPGLSIVVPWVDPEITFGALLNSLMRGWFVAILTGDLVVELEEPGRRLELNSSSLKRHLSDCDERTRTEMAPLIDLAEAYCKVVAENREPPKLGPPDPESAPKWSEAMLPEDLRKILVRALDTGDHSVVRVPIAVRLKDNSRLQSHFDIAFVRDDRVASGRVTFLRNDIIIPEVRHSKPRGVRAMVIAKHGPLANLLRDAEHPAHTHWSKDTSNFKDKYRWGPSSLSFVQNSAGELLDLVLADQVDEEPRLLVDFFSVPAPPEEEDDGRGPRRRKKRPEEPEPPPRDIPGTKPRAVSVTRVSGGFSVGRGSADATLPQFLKIRVAYDVSAGSPFKAWHRADFHFGRDGGVSIAPDCRGIEIGERIDNRLLVGIVEPDFHFTVKGFDEGRDLVIKIDTEQPDDQAD